MGGALGAGVLLTAWGLGCDGRVLSTVGGLVGRSDMGTPYLKGVHTALPMLRGSTCIQRGQLVFRPRAEKHSVRIFGAPADIRCLKRSPGGI